MTHEEKLERILELIYQNKRNGEFIDWLYYTVKGEEE
tara:strand:- start:20331 stop:20441 length:111 start_codon:yes stop_codon:yes gene_type:complete